MPGTSENGISTRPIALESFIVLHCKMYLKGALTSNKRRGSKSLQQLPDKTPTFLLATVFKHVVDLHLAFETLG